jgi:hypothetical protein
MGGSRRTNGEEEERIEVGKQKERNHLKDQDVCGWIILTRILER